MLWTVHLISTSDLGGGADVFHACFSTWIQYLKQGRIQNKRKEGAELGIDLTWCPWKTASGSRKKPPHPDTASWVLSKHCSCYLASRFKQWVSRMRKIIFKGGGGGGGGGGGFGPYSPPPGSAPVKLMDDVKNASLLLLRVFWVPLPLSRFTNYHTQISLSTICSACYGLLLPSLL